MVKEQPYADLQLGVAFSYKKFIPWWNFEFEVIKQCSANRWVTLYQPRIFPTLLMAIDADPLGENLTLCESISQRSWVAIQYNNFLLEFWHEKPLEFLLEIS